MWGVTRETFTWLGSTVLLIETSRRTKFRPGAKDCVVYDLLICSVPRKDIKVRSMKLLQMSFVTFGQNFKAERKKNVSLNALLSLQLSNINNSLQNKAWRLLIKAKSQSEVTLRHLTQVDVWIKVRFE